MANKADKHLYEKLSHPEKGERKRGEGGKGGKKGEPRRKNKIQTIICMPEFCKQTRFSYKTEKFGYIF